MRAQRLSRSNDGRAEEPTWECTVCQVDEGVAFATGATTTPSRLDASERKVLG